VSEFTTRVSDVRHGFVNLRGYSLEQVMRHLTHTQGAFLSIVGRLPAPAEVRIVDALLNSLLDHGFVASTITASRYIASGNPQFIPAVAGGLLAAGSNTLSPGDSFELIERIDRICDEECVGIDEAAASVVAEYRDRRARVPGLGHPTHKDRDFRADVLFDLMTELGLESRSVSIYQAIHREFVRQSGKSSIPVNIDGALAAVGRDLGWSVNQTIAFALLSVLPGLMAHVAEELAEGRPLRHITSGDYVGPPVGPLPAMSELANGSHEKAM
jgi:citrate synthase